MREWSGYKMERKHPGLQGTSQKQSFVRQPEEAEGFREQGQIM